MTGKVSIPTFVVVESLAAITSPLNYALSILIIDHPQSTSVTTIEMKQSSATEPGLSELASSRRDPGHPLTNGDDSMLFL
ncbi:hypothetical protein B0H19DRAFT_1277196 [Mycena capillaripes]|nr:hypothetical protein B0H19DRAFT_1277196 [Mycena capillaripes]